MKCSSRSTISRRSARALAAVLAGAWLAAGTAGVARPAIAPAAPADSHAAVRAAIVAAIRARVGGAADVRLDRLAAQTTTTDGLIAVPEPGARMGRLTRFVLEVPGTGRWQMRRQVGDAAAVIHVFVPHVVVARPVPGGTTLSQADLRVSTGEIVDVPLGPLPSLSDVVGARAVQNLRTGEPVTGMLVAVPPLVRSGDSVLVHVTFPGGEVTGRATAAENGVRGQIIRLVNPTSGRGLQGRVVGPDEVEVIR
ncbi:MAG TPA: flagellar basal body P-ring formation chaperone FlgA [Vicinamibacterales bacterium]|nr:flagellar basal body P-ring formation chaperone FlgA [Vicinamibacterales bacterium]